MIESMTHIFQVAHSDWLEISSTGGKEITPQKKNFQYIHSNTIVHKIPS